MIGRIWRCRILRLILIFMNIFNSGNLLLTLWIDYTSQWFFPNTYNIYLDRGLFAKGNLAHFVFRAINSIPTVRHHPLWGKVTGNGCWMTISDKLAKY
jgi:hypothetical protein